jgi:hypothetical protein
MKKSQVLSLFMILLIALVSFNCSGDNATSPPAAIFSYPVIVTGLNITDQDPVVLGVWGMYTRGIVTPPPFSSTMKYIDPAFAPPPPRSGEGSPLPTTYAAYQPYPNPAKKSINIGFDLPLTSKVTIWVERAYLPSGNMPATGGSSASPVLTRLYVLTDTMEPGYHHFVFTPDTTVSSFYRVYYQLGTYLISRDIMIYQNELDMPPSLRSAVSQVKQNSIY